MSNGLSDHSKPKFPTLIQDTINSGLWDKLTGEGLSIPFKRLFLFNEPFELYPSRDIKSLSAYVKSPTYSEIYEAFKKTGDDDPDSVYVIGDFGIGSDTMVALDYRKNKDNPSILCGELDFCWTKDYCKKRGWGNCESYVDKCNSRWSTCGDSFDVIFNSKAVLSYNKN